jgi:hypothetical protein
MSFLDFIKNRGQAASAPVNEQVGPGPETAKQMYTREAAQEKTGTPSVKNLSPEQLAEARDIGSQLLQPTTPPEPTSPAPSTFAPTEAPSGATDNQQPMKQLSMNQEKGAPALSPSSAQLGMKDAELPARAADTPSATRSSPKPTRSMSPDL